MLLIKIFLSVQMFLLFFFTKKENLVKPATPLFLASVPFDYFDDTQYKFAHDKRWCWEGNIENQSYFPLPVSSNRGSILFVFSVFLLKRLCKLLEMAEQYGR